MFLFCQSHLFSSCWHFVSRHAVHAIVHRLENIQLIHSLDGKSDERPRARLQNKLKREELILQPMHTNGISVNFSRSHSFTKRTAQLHSKTSRDKKKTVCKNLIQRIEWLSVRLEQLIDGFTAN